MTLAIVHEVDRSTSTEPLNSERKMIDWKPPPGKGDSNSSPPSTGPPLPPRPFKCSSLSSSSFSSHSSHSSNLSYSSLSSFSPPPSTTGPPRMDVSPIGTIGTIGTVCSSVSPMECTRRITSSDEEPVYVTSSSTILLIDQDDDANIYDVAYETSPYSISSYGTYSGTPSECHSARMRSIFYEDVNECQEISCYVEEDELKNDDGQGSIAEAIYEVISPVEDGHVSLGSCISLPNINMGPENGPQQLGVEAPAKTLNISHENDNSKNSCSSHQSENPTSKQTVLNQNFGSGLGGIYSLDPSLEERILRRKYERSLLQQGPCAPHKITRIAEVANSGMRKLRRNWTEVRTGLSKIKKRNSGLSLMIDAKSADDILNESCESSPSSTDRSRWSTLSSPFKWRPSLGVPLSTPQITNEHSDKKYRNNNNAVFYLSLNGNQEISNGDSEPRTPVHWGSSSSLEPYYDDINKRKRRNSLASSIGVSDTSIDECDKENIGFRRQNRPLSTPGGGLSRNSSMGSTYGMLSRPTNPPPAPPKRNNTEEGDNNDDIGTDMSRDMLVSKLNQLLLMGPGSPEKRGLYVSPAFSMESEALQESCTKDLSAISLRQLFQQDESHSSLLPETEATSLPSTKEHRTSRFEPATMLVDSQNNSQSITASLSSSSSTEVQGCLRNEYSSSAVPPPLPARPNLTLSVLPKLPHSFSLTESNKTTVIKQSPTVTKSSRAPPMKSKSFGGLSCEDSEVPGVVSSQFADEPLYQFYTAKVEWDALYQAPSSEDDYEVISDGNVVSNPTISGCRPSAMELVTPTDGRRTLWCELPEVVNSGILDKISNQEKKIQEAIFEVLTSEASYLKSLNVLVSHFMDCPEFSQDDDTVISRRDRNILFSDILAVKLCSELLLCDLERRWQESFLISGISDIVLKHASSSFNVYVKYCSNQIYQDRKLRDLKENNPRFVEVLSRLEGASVCQSLAMQSFLMLPMQRVTRLPLLVDAIFNRLEYGSPQWQDCKRALASLQKIVLECNEGARKMERMEEMLLISNQLDFREVRAIPLISASRWLVKKGELTRLTWRDGDTKLTFGRKISKHTLYFFLFTDLLVVAKKKSDDQHAVLDYCPRNMVQVMELDGAEKFPGRVLDGHKNLMIMTMLQNHENKTVEMVLSCPMESERSRWVEAVTPRASENPDERIYEEWDCPQVQAIHAYTAEQPDEISLEISDVFNVLKKTSDGWYQGERLRDGVCGWFPGNHTSEIASAHVRARNLRQRYRILAISSSIVDEMLKKERAIQETRKKERRKTTMASTAVKDLG